MMAIISHNILKLLCIFVVIIKFSNCERLHKQIYSSIEGGAACFRRLNGTQQAGCSSSNKGTVGAVQMVRKIDDAQWIAFNGTAGPYMAVVSTAIFHEVIEILMSHPENVAGILLFANVTMSAHAFTQDSKCPNEYSSGPGSQCSSQNSASVWNEAGTDLLRRDIPFPIFYLPESKIEEIEKIENCYERYNVGKSQNDQPLCSLQLSSFMFAAVNSVVCLRRSATTALLTPTKVCDPLGDNNVYYSLFPRGKETNATKKPVVLATARIDTATLFDGVSPGAASSVVGAVTLITAAATLAQVIPASDAHLYKRNVLWTLFNGEAFDYIGSQRVAYDISRRAWPAVAPLSESDIPLHLEIGQLGGSLLTNKDSDAWPMYAYVPDNMEIRELFLQQMSSNLAAYNMTLEPVFSSNIPPSSLHSFRRILQNATSSGAIREVLLTDYKEKFTNLFYNSALDDYDKIGFVYRNISIGSDGKFVSTEELLANGTMKSSDVQVKIARLATALAHTLHEQVADVAYAGNVTASAHLVDEMLYCFLVSQSCRLLAAADYHSGARAEPLPAAAAPLYVGVAAWGSTAPVFAGHLLALLAGQPLPANRTLCDAQSDQDYSYYWLRGWNDSGVCIQTTMNFSQAVSPAFIIPDYDFTSGEYSTWTESVWQAMWARVFVSASGAGARLAAVAGAGATALAAALTFWIHRHSSIVFVNAPAALVNNDAASGILRTVNC
ncbi:nicastrin [Plodia interpunctella]|uniref:nicastrin n=1 Tax=Plodia interpunctella TaxID=58824 RepID=UPI002367BB68|nr:nicastrin [Plodia interpunctella]